MPTSAFVLAIDQGTTSSRAIVFDGGYRVVGVGQQEFPQHFPRSGWVEHDPEDIWRTVVETVRIALGSAGISAGDLAAIGITNQRETTVVWDRATGKAIHNAIVWQDRRTADTCARLKAEGAEAAVSAKTGLLLDPYFSGTKIAWILDHVSGARRAPSRRLAFGRRAGQLPALAPHGRPRARDGRDQRLAHPALRHPPGRLGRRFAGADQGSPRHVADGDGQRGRFRHHRSLAVRHGVAIRGIAGDQQAATVGQACFRPGMMKSTYGTGCFAVLNTGSEFVASQNRLLTTIAYQLDGKPTYALEGSIFVAGAAVQWLRDGLHVIDRADQTGPLADAADPNQNVYLVPAFTGLGAPWWDAEARGALFGLTRATGPKELARAALEAVCYQTRDLIDAMHKDFTPPEATVLRVDGGMVASDWTMQRLADLIDACVDRPVVLETTALGAAWLAGRQAGVWPDEAGFSESWRLDRRFEPAMAAETREAKLAGWRDAVRRTLTAG